MKITEDELQELRRMLQWFREQLPAHDVQVWQISVQEVPPADWVERDPDSSPWETGRHWRVAGYGRCARCNHQFDIPRIGNAQTYAKERIPQIVEEMKAWVCRGAEQAGLCWGDIPHAPSTTPEGAVLDAVAWG